MDNFDKNLLMKKGREQYHLDKVKGGRSGSTAGQPRPRSRQTIFIALLYSPKSVGRTFAVKPKKDFMSFRFGRYYEWKVFEPGWGVIDGVELSADAIKENFIIINRRKSS